MRQAFRDAITSSRHSDWKFALVLFCVLFILSISLIGFHVLGGADTAARISTVGYQRHDSVLQAAIAAELKAGDTSRRDVFERTRARFGATRDLVLKDPPRSASPDQIETYRRRTAAFQDAMERPNATDRDLAELIELATQTERSIDVITRAYAEDAENEGDWLVGSIVATNLFVFLIIGLIGARVISPQFGKLRRESEQARLEVETLFSTSPTIMCVADLEGRFIRINDATESILGYEAEEMEGRTFLDFVHKDDHEKTVDATESLTDGAVLKHFQNRYVAKDGTIKQLEWRSIAHEATGRIYGIAMDVTPTHELMNGLAAKSRELERSNAALDDFAYVASHDLRAPLRDIENLASWIVEDVGEDLPSASREHLAKILDRIDRMDQLLSDLLRYSRIGRVGTEVALVEDFEALCRESIELAGIPDEFTVHVDVDVDSIETPRTPLKQVMTNLLSNAAKHHDRRDGNIWVRAHTSGSNLIVEVADDGPGIKPEFQDRIFELFQTLKPKTGNSGLGLALIRKIVAEFGGKISLESNPGQGATFRLEWPLDWPARNQQPMEVA